MSTYTYEATTRDGSTITGTIEAVNEHLAVDRIQDMGYFPLKVEKSVEERSFLSDLPGIFQKRVGQKEIMGFTYQMGVLMEAGFPLERSLTLQAELTEKRALKDIINELISLVRSGKSFSEALSRFPAVFPLYYVNMIKAGESGGFLEDTISQMADYIENSENIKGEVRSALIYPFILVFFGGIAVTVLLTFVVPRFSSIFADMGGALPLPTVMLLFISNFLINHWWAIILLLSGLFFAVRHYLMTETGRRLWDRERFRIPLFGKLFTEAAVSRFARTLGTLLGSGVPLLNALQIVKGTFGSESISEVLDSVREEVRKGRGISGPLKKSGIFPPIAVHMVTVGEETGKLDDMLLKVAERFDIEVKTTVKRMLSILEPALIIIVAIIVAFIVIAMLLAIFSINDLPM